MSQGSQAQWVENFKKNSPYIQERLTMPGCATIATRLRAKGLLELAEYEEVMQSHNTASNAAGRIMYFILKNEEKLLDSVVTLHDILKNDLHRSKLANWIASPQQDASSSQTEQNAYPSAGTIRPSVVRPVIGATGGTENIEDMKEKTLSISKHRLYVMRSSPHGICLIINNVNFKNDSRLGSCEDAEKLNHIFTMLNYKVIQKDDLTSTQMKDALTMIATLYQVEYDSFICCILSHGDERGVYGTDGTRVRIDEVMEPFDGAHCPSMAEKPKMYFIQACRGSKEQKAMLLDEMYTDDPNSTDGGRSVAPKGHFLMSFSTIPGHLSYRLPGGSPFISTLCKVLEEDFKRSTLAHMLFRVNDLMGEFESKGYKQTPMPQYTLSRDVFFGDYDSFFPPIQQTTN